MSFVYRYLQVAVLSLLLFIEQINGSGSTTITNVLNIQLTIASACSVSVTTLNFGNYNALLSTPLTATATINITCTNSTPYQIGLNAGTAGTSVTARKMSLGNNMLNYGLYQNSGATTIWGNTTGTNTLHATGTGTQQSFTIYGQIPIGQTVPKGSYTDTVIATIYF